MPFEQREGAVRILGLEDAVPGNVRAGVGGAGGADLGNYSGRVSDSGEGRWTLAAANELSVPAPILASALFSRFASRGEADFQNRLLSALRQQFGGHAEKPQQ